MREWNKWNQLQNLSGEVVLEHFLFGGQTYKCDAIQVINDEQKIGILIKGKELFVYKQKVVDFCTEGNIYRAGDDFLKIIVKLFKKR